MTPFPHIPDGSILGLNYSGAHDSSIAVVAPNGEVVFATSLERVSRTKQDGRVPRLLLDSLNLADFNSVAISTNRNLPDLAPSASRILDANLPNARPTGLRHSPAFLNQLTELVGDADVCFVDHQQAHASLAAFGSGYERGACLVYDGGMHNCHYFGGVFSITEAGAVSSDLFDSRLHPKITTLYSVVTALLGFTPNKHEGKITGLAARGTPSPAIRRKLEEWFLERYEEIEGAVEWLLPYSEDHSPQLYPRGESFPALKTEVQEFPIADVAATLQVLTELHLTKAVEKAISQRLINRDEPIAMAGGLFANVSVNRAIADLGFPNVYVAPAMGDDGTALGAAYHRFAEVFERAPQTLSSVYLGRSAKATQEFTKRRSRLNAAQTSPPAIAELIFAGYTVAIFQGRSEFGPRALGNRSILARANDSAINDRLNAMLNRTEFMPFAPVLRADHAPKAFMESDRVAGCLPYMTMAVECTTEFSRLHPAAVHIDSTARPQCVTATSNPFLYDVLLAFEELGPEYALINTSFNVHEEPIVDSLDDALRGFFASGIDYLWLEDLGLVSQSENSFLAVEMLRETARAERPQVGFWKSAYTLAVAERDRWFDEAVEKETVIQELAAALRAQR